MVSPLVSLMEDQLLSLQQYKVEASLLNASSTKADVNRVHAGMDAMVDFHWTRVQTQIPIYSCRNWNLNLISVQCKNFCIVQCSHQVWSLNPSPNPAV